VCPCEGCKGDARPINNKSNYIFMCVHVKVVEGMIGPLNVQWTFVTYSRYIKLVVSYLEVAKGAIIGDYFNGYGCL
jgi:hypothetical protein